MQPQHLDVPAYNSSRNRLTDGGDGGDVFNTAVRTIIDAYGANAESEGDEIACVRGESPRSAAEDMINHFEADLDSAQRQAFQTAIASALMRYVGATGARKLEIRAHIGMQKPDGLDGDGGSMYWVRAFDGDHSYGDELPQIHRHLTPEGEKMALENNSELNALYGDHFYLFLAIGAPQVNDGGALAQEQDALPEQGADMGTDPDIKACLDTLAEIDPAQAQALRDSYEAGALGVEELKAVQAVARLHDMQALAALAPDAEGAGEMIEAVRKQVSDAALDIDEPRIQALAQNLVTDTPETVQITTDQAPGQRSDPAINEQASVTPDDAPVEKAPSTLETHQTADMQAAVPPEAKAQATAFRANMAGKMPIAKEKPQTRQAESGRSATPEAPVQNNTDSRGQGQDGFAAQRRETPRSETAQAAGQQASAQKADVTSEADNQSAPAAVNMQAYAPAQKQPEPTRDDNPAQGTQTPNTSASVDAVQTVTEVANAPTDKAPSLNDTAMPLNVNNADHHNKHYVAQDRGIGPDTASSRHTAQDKGRVAGLASNPVKSKGPAIATEDRRSSPMDRPVDSRFGYSDGHTGGTGRTRSGDVSFTAGRQISETDRTIEVRSENPESPPRDDREQLTKIFGDACANCRGKNCGQCVMNAGTQQHEREHDSQIAPGPR